MQTSRPPLPISLSNVIMPISHAAIILALLFNHIFKFIFKYLNHPLFHDLYNKKYVLKTIAKLYAYTERSSICKFPYITRPITVIWHDHIIHRVIAYEAQLSTYHTGSRSFTYHIDSRVNNVIHWITYQSCEAYTSISHIIRITSMLARLLES